MRHPHIFEAMDIPTAAATAVFGLAEDSSFDFSSPSSFRMCDLGE